MNILITGANGFIGQALCKRMLAVGYQVRGAVRRQEKTEVGCLRSDVRSRNKAIHSMIVLTCKARRAQTTQIKADRDDRKY